MQDSADELEVECDSAAADAKIERKRKLKSNKTGFRAKMTTESVPFAVQWIPRYERIVSAAPGKFLVSPHFGTRHKNTVFKWMLVFYPNGYPTGRPYQNPNAKNRSNAYTGGFLNADAESDVAANNGSDSDMSEPMGGFGSDIFGLHPPRPPPLDTSRKRECTNQSAIYIVLIPFKNLQKKRLRVRADVEFEIGMVSKEGRIVKSIKNVLFRPQKFNDLKKNDVPPTFLKGVKDLGPRCRFLGSKMNIISDERISISCRLRIDKQYFNMFDIFWREPDAQLPDTLFKRLRTNDLNDDDVADSDSDLDEEVIDMEHIEKYFPSVSSFDFKSTIEKMSSSATFADDGEIDDAVVNGDGGDAAAAAAVKGDDDDDDDNDAASVSVNDEKKKKQKQKMKTKKKKKCCSLPAPDVTLISSDGQEFQCHYSKLKKNEYFALLFNPKNSFVESTKRSSHLPDVEGKILNQLLYFIYFHELAQDAKESAVDLLYVAEKYLVKNLGVLCKLMLKLNLNAENLFDYMKAAMLYDLADLKESCLDMIVCNAEALLKIGASPSSAASLTFGDKMLSDPDFNVAVTKLLCKRSLEANGALCLH